MNKSENILGLQGIPRALIRALFLSVQNGHEKPLGKSWPWWSASEIDFEVRKFLMSPDGIYYFITTYRSVESYVAFWSAPDNE